MVLFEKLNLIESKTPLIVCGDFNIGIKDSNIYIPETFNITNNNLTHINAQNVPIHEKPDRFDYIIIKKNEILKFDEINSKFLYCENELNILEKIKNNTFKN